MSPAQSPGGTLAHQRERETGCSQNYCYLAVLPAVRGPGAAVAVMGVDAAAFVVVAVMTGVATHIAGDMSAAHQLAAGLLLLHRLLVQICRHQHVAFDQLINVVRNKID